MLFATDFEALEVYGCTKNRSGNAFRIRFWGSGGVWMHQKSIRRPSQGSRKSFKKLIRGSLEMLWELLEVHKAPQATILDTFIVFRDSKRPPGGPQVTIYRPCRRFRASRRLWVGVEPGLIWGWFGTSRGPREPHESKISGYLDIILLL